MLPQALCIRLACIVATAGVCVAWRHAPSMFVWATYAVGFTHYLLALRYSSGQMRQLLTAPSQVLALLGLGLLAVALYQTDFPLFLYFGLHHALNEAYLRRPAAGPPAAMVRLNAAAAAFHAAAYLTALRWAREMVWIDAQLTWIAFAAAAGLLAWTISHTGVATSRRQLLELCAPEATSAALVALSLFIRLTFLEVVLYHFMLWALLPIVRIRRRNSRGGLAEYAALSLALTGVALLLSPLGPSATRLTMHTYSEQFLFWSYLHITLSFALSDAHPAWTVRFFRGADRRDLSVAPAAG